jgi:hypothetical protein
VAVVVEVSFRRGEEEEKTKQPDNNVDAKIMVVLFW